MPNFRVTQERLLEVDLNNEKIMARTGAMVAYTGNLKFDKALLGGEGVFGALKRTVTGEGFNLMTVQGTGTVYIANLAQQITIIELRNEKIFVESRSVLAFETTLKSDTAFAGLRGAASGQGVFTTTLSGNGSAAILSHGSLIGLQVDQSTPVLVDPDAFIAYNGNVRHEFVFDVDWKTLVGATGGESFQMKFTGQGNVYVQPSEIKL